MRIADIEAIQEALPYYENFDIEATNQARLELADLGFAYESNLDKLQADKAVQDQQQVQARLNARLLTNIRSLLPKPVNGVMVAHSDDELERIAKNVVWDDLCPTYLIGRKRSSRDNRFGKALLDHTVNSSMSPEGIEVVRVHNGDVNRFLNNGSIRRGLDKKTAEKIFNFDTGEYNLKPSSAIAVRLTDKPGIWSRRIRQRSFVRNSTTQRYNRYGAADSIPAIPDSALREYEVLHHVARLAANFGLIPRLSEVLEDHKQVAIDA